MKDGRTECLTCPRRSGIFVPPEIRPGARLFLVGEAPGEEESKEGRPFVPSAPAGGMLDLLLNKAGLDRDRVSLANVCCCYEAGNRTPGAEEIAACAGLLEEALAQGQAKVVVALGATATTRLTGTRSITAWRGSIIEASIFVPIGKGRVLGPDRFGPKAKKAGQLKPHNVDFTVQQEPRTVVVTNHPADLLPGRGGMGGFPIVLAHLKRARRLAQGERLIEVGTTLTTERNATAEKMALLLATPEAREKLTLDLETDGIGGKIEIIGLSIGRDHGMAAQATPETLVTLCEALPQTRLLVGHNIAYDLGVLSEQLGYRHEGPLWDTMHAAHFDRPDLSGVRGDQDRDEKKKSGRRRSKDLALVASRLHDHRYYNWKAALKEGRRKDPFEYCALDCAWTSAIQIEQEKNFTATGRLKLFRTVLMPLVPVLSRMEQEGVQVDVEVRDRLWREQVALEARLLQNWDAETKGIDQNSPVALIAYFYFKLGLRPIIKHPKTGRPTLNREALEELFELHPDVPALKILVGLRHVQKIRSTYLDVEPIDGRFHPYFDLSGTETGRLSGDMQQVPRVGESCKVKIAGCVCVKLRDMFIKDDGDWAFAAADYSQIENRLTALLAGEQWLVEAFEREDFDQHRETADALGVERNVGKQVNHALDRMAGYVKLARVTGVSQMRAKQFVALYERRYPQIVRARQRWIGRVREQGWIANPYGRRGYFVVGSGGKVHGPAVVSFMPQSTAADVMLIALRDMAREGLKLRLSEHDEIDLSLRGPEEKERVRQIMEQRHSELGRWRCPVQIGTGRSWAEAKKS